MTRFGAFSYAELQLFVMALTAAGPAAAPVLAEVLAESWGRQVRFSICVQCRCSWSAGELEVHTLDCPVWGGGSIH